jgi:hypothetical protein
VNGFANNPLPLFDVPKPGEPAKPTLAELGIDKNLADRARKLAAISDSVIEARLAGWRAKAERADRVMLDILRGDRGEHRRAVHPVRGFGGSVDEPPDSRPRPSSWTRRGNSSPGAIMVEAPTSAPTV